MSNEQQNIVDLTKVTVEDLESIRQRNSQKLQAIRQQGANLDISGIAARRLDTLIELLLTQEQRVQFEFAFETNMSDILDDALVELRKASLVQGVTKKQELIIPGAN